MAENGSNLFRKSSLERVSSPDQLNEYIKVTNPNLIVMLIGIFTILAAGVIWIFSGVIPKTVAISGIVATDNSGQEAVYCFIPLGTSKRLSEGMEAQISPNYADSEQYGYIKGTVKSIGKKIVTSEYLSSNFEDPGLFAPLLASASAENLVEVVLSMDKWSSDQGEKVDVRNGSLCEASIVVGGTKPYELIFNR